MKKLLVNVLSAILILIPNLVHSQLTIPEAQSRDDINYKLELIVSDLNNPWGLAFLPDGSLLISEKSGVLLHYENGIKNRVANLPEVLVSGQGGLLDLELHPQYKENGWIYMSMSSPSGEGKGGHTAIFRAKLKSNALTNIELIYKGKPNTSSGVHWGSRIEFDNDGFLYFSIGDRYNRDVNPQDIKKDGGKIYRLHDDGQVPKDNPFINTTGAKKAIYSYGHRNPQGMAIHPTTGTIWIHEHGPKGGDEINIIKKGRNYGWPKITYGRNYIGTKITNNTSAPNMEQPFYYWLPSIAPCGMIFVNSTIYPEWKGNLLVGSLKFRYLEHLIIKNNRIIKREKLFENIGRLRNVRQAPDGYIYIAVEGKGIYKIVPSK